MHSPIHSPSSPLQPHTSISPINIGPSFSPPPLNVSPQGDSSNIFSSSSSSTLLSSQPTSVDNKNLRKTKSAILNCPKHLSNKSSYEENKKKVLGDQSERPVSLTLNMNKISNSNSNDDSQHTNANSSDGDPFSPQQESPPLGGNETVTCTSSGTVISSHKYCLCVFMSSISLLIDIIWNTKPTKRELDEERKKNFLEKNGKKKFEEEVESDMENEENS
jgi:hypothetical protein